MAIAVSAQFDKTADCILFQGHCLDLLSQIPDEFAKLVVTSPPYNLGKPYESQRALDEYLAQQRQGPSHKDQQRESYERKGTLCPTEMNRQFRQEFESRGYCEIVEKGDIGRYVFMPSDPRADVPRLLRHPRRMGRC
nr:hypothetical protein [Chloroflexota bacterium]